MNFNFFKNQDGKTLIYDKIRKKKVLLTPEEWVRQNFIDYLIQVKQYPKILFSVEKKVSYNRLSRRFDILIYLKTGNPKILVECKSFKKKLNQDNLYQVAQYNFNLNCQYLILTNGLEAIFYEVCFDLKKIKILSEIPEYSNI